MEHGNHQTSQAGKLILLTLLGVLTLKAITQTEAGKLPRFANADTQRVATS